jgi:hypothetical protein
MCHFCFTQYAPIRILTILPAGTNPIHNKKPKKKVVEEDEDDKAHKLKLAAGRILQEVRKTSTTL